MIVKIPDIWGRVLIEWRPMCLHQISEMQSCKLRPSKRNARTHSKKQVEQIVNSIRRFGWTYPILVDELGNILCGVGRWLAAQTLGLAHVPVIVMPNLSDTEKRALALADNKIASNAAWDRKILAAELGELAVLLPEINLDLEITGFEAGEIDSLMGDLVDLERDPIDELPQLATKPISRAGDFWHLDRHRLYCGDSCDPSDVRALMGREQAAMIFADPPFNVRIGATVGRGKIKHREFAFASGEMSPSQFMVFLGKWMRLAAQFSADGSIHYVCIDWRHIAEMLAAGNEVFGGLKNLVVWVKTNAGQGSLYRSQHEFVCVFKNGEGRHQNNIELGLTGLGGDMFIIDDPQKPDDAQSETLRNGVNQWFSNTLRSRLDNKETGVIIIVMQRVHLHDLTGHLVENSSGWTVLNLAALAEEDEEIAIGNGKFHLRRAGEALHPEYESRATLETLRSELGSEIFAAQYQQSPVPPGGAMIRRDWLRYYDVAPERTYMTKVIQSWDTSAKDGAQNDWSVCTTWLVVDKRNYYLLDLTRGRYEYPRLRETAIALAQRYKPSSVLIEDASTGIALAQELRQAGTFVVKAIPIDRDKVGRLWLQQAKFEAGLVHFPRSAPWLSVLETELLTFPQSKHDDQVDSISQALAFKTWGYDTTMAWVG
jgi:predicted phage terminase large subunit-like protein